MNPNYNGPFLVNFVTVKRFVDFIERKAINGNFLRDATLSIIQFRLQKAVELGSILQIIRHIDLNALKSMRRNRNLLLTAQCGHQHFFRSSVFDLSLLTSAHSFLVVRRRLRLLGKSNLAFISLT